MTTTLYMPANHSSVWKLADQWPLAWLLSPVSFKMPVRDGRRIEFAIDNAMYHAPDQPPKGQKAIPPFYAMLEKVFAANLSPLWAVAPDVPYHGAESLELSMKHVAEMRKRWPWCPVAIAVQDGMSIDVLDMAPWRACFVAGSDEWKDRTMQAWIEGAHERGMIAHVARVNSWKRADACRRYGADSADGTSWGRGRRQQIEDVMRGLWPERSIGDVRAAARVVAPREVAVNLWNT
jgi:hypothetical protein